MELRTLSEGVRETGSWDANWKEHAKPLLLSFLPLAEKNQFHSQ
jgi:hypothetical protein